jgi:hypothetical protein
MKIELKNVKFSDFASEETNCFRADVYVNGKKVGYCNNDGHGGNTNVRIENRNEVEDYCKSLPPIDFGGLMVDSNLENVVDMLFEEWLKEKSRKDLKKKLKKFMLTGICIEEENGFSVMTFKLGGKVMLLSDLFKVEKYVENIRQTCMTLKADGKTILNTNLPFEI